MNIWRPTVEALETSRRSNSLWETNEQRRSEPGDYREDPEQPTAMLALEALDAKQDVQESFPRSYILKTKRLRGPNKNEIVMSPMSRFIFFYLRNL